MHPKTKTTLSFHSMRGARYIVIIKRQKACTRKAKIQLLLATNNYHTMKLLPIAFAILLSFSSSQVLGSSNGNSSYDNESLEDSYKRLKNEGCRNCPGGKRDWSSAAMTCPPGAGAYCK